MNGKSGPRLGCNLGHVLWYLWRTLPSHTDGITPCEQLPSPCCSALCCSCSSAAPQAVLSAPSSSPYLPKPLPSASWDLGERPSSSGEWMQGRGLGDGLVASMECTDSVFRNRSMFGKDRQGQEWLWWTARAELSSIGHARRWKICFCDVTENSRNYMYVLSLGQLTGLW